jgi:anaerobic selenocysteine-containing dehydrogenase
MCRESTSVAPPESIGVSVGAVTLQDFEQADLLLYIAHNPGTLAPRILHQLQNAVKRGVEQGFRALAELSSAPVRRR